jgi:gluconolactonase
MNPRFGARLMLLAALACSLTGCSIFKKDKPQAATRPAWGHGGVMANDTNPPFMPKVSSGPLGVIEKYDPAFDALFAPEAMMEKLVEGLDWAEGPIWHKDSQSLLFSDVPQNVVYRWHEVRGVHRYVRPSGYTGTVPRGGEPGSNGLTLDSLGRLVLCQHGDRAVSRLQAIQPALDPNEPMHPVYVPIVDRYQGKRFNSPNDLCFDKNGNLYFTDPPYGLVGNVNDPEKEIPFQGVYRFSNKGLLTLLTKEMTRPNGIALSPDEKTLYVANSDPDKAIWMAYPIKEDGTLDKGKVFFDATDMAKDKEHNKGLPDGLKIDAKGNLFATGPGGVLVFSPDGKHLGTLRTGEATANVAWGDDGTLYICADMYIARIKTQTGGK